jgi:ankyrin repeat protein
VGCLDIVRLLAKYGADVNVQDRWGTTPLMLTVVGESRAAAETLIELGANIHSRNVSHLVKSIITRNVDDGDGVMRRSMAKRY